MERSGSKSRRFTGLSKPPVWDTWTEIHKGGIEKTTKSDPDAIEETYRKLRPRILVLEKEVEFQPKAKTIAGRKQAFESVS